MKKLLSVVTIILFGLAMPGFASVTMQPNAQLQHKSVAQQSDKILVVVNDDVITQSELEQKIAAVKQQALRAQVTLPPEQQLRDKILDDLITTKLQLQIAKRNKITVSDAELAAAIQNIAKQNGVTVAVMKKQIVQQEGISFARLEQQIREQMLLSKLAQQFLARDINVDDAEVTAVMNNPPKLGETATHYHVVDVVVEVADMQQSQQVVKARELATTIATELKQTTDFKQIEVKHASKEVKVNDLGWRKLNELPGLFEATVDKMQIDEVVGPLQAPNGMHVIKLLERNGTAKAVKLTKEQAQQIVFQQKMAERLKTWLQEVRASAYIKKM